jgi:prophage maintenance system killer protein
MAAAFSLEREGYRLDVEEDDLYKQTYAAAEGRLTLDAIAAWLETNAVPLG